MCESLVLHPFSNDVYYVSFVAASEWVARQKIVDFDLWSKMYISCVFSPIQSAGASSASLDADTVALLKGALSYHQRYDYLHELHFG